MYFHGTRRSHLLVVETRYRSTLEEEERERREKKKGATYSLGEKGVGWGADERSSHLW